MLNIGTRNTSTQTVLTDALINIGFVYSKYCKKTCQGLPAFSNTSNGITINAEGKYHIIGTFVASGTEAGILTINSLENGIENGFFSSETITTADTELRTFTLDFYVTVDQTCILGIRSTRPITISFENAGVGATFTLASVSIDKVV